MSEINELNRAIALYRQGILEESESILNQLVNIPSLKESSHYYLGLIKIGLQKHAAAINHLDQAIASNPTKPEYLFNKAISLGQLGDYKTCLEILSILEKKLPNSSTILFNKAVALGKIGDRNSEFLLYSKILSTDPSNQEALNNIAVCCNELNQTDQALSYINFLLSINPDHLSALKTKTDILKKLGLLNDAHISLKEYLNLSYKKNLISAEINSLCLEIIKLINIPPIYKNTNDVEVIRNQINEVLQSSNKLVNKVMQPSDSEFEILLSVLIRVNLFYLAYQQKNDREINEAFCSLINQVLKHRVPSYTELKSPQSKKIRLGVLSRFKYHVDTDIFGWIEQLPLENYELFFIRINAEPSAPLPTFGTCIDIQFDESNINFLVLKVRDLNLDAIFMQDIGMTSDGKLLSNIRFAPIQFTNWSHPVTTGSKVIDYYLSSDLMEPENAESHYSENLIRLPNLGLCIPTYQFKDLEFKKKLDSNFFNIGCMQSLFKYLPQDDDVFIEICKRIPNAQLIFIDDVTKATTNFFKDRLKSGFKVNKLDFNKFVKFFPRMTHDEFMNLLNEIDVSLDSIGWSGGNTSLQALSLGKPILSIQGEFMRGRHTSAMLNLLELINLQPLASKDDLFKVIEELAKNKEKLSLISQEILRKNKILFNDHKPALAIHEFIKRVTKSN